MARKSLFLAMAFILSASTAEAKVVSGPVQNLCETSTMLDFDALAGTSNKYRMEMFWSVADEAAETGYFYKQNTHFPPDAFGLAVATGVSDVAQIANAAAYSYPSTVDIVGPLTAGSVVLYHNATTGYYAAIQIDSMVPQGRDGACSNEPYVLNGWWYIQDDGTGDFSSATLP